ncbi:hypothetical protein MYX84_12820 [Acidobacteria bacterium AH-259-O06]|nr:hypothetical protein [Acidobacteria bacterium AH-259-G07]MDA2930805.1 hypothetical protein [Acidobacteria bacterium AH-259-O06]
MSSQTRKTGRMEKGKGLDVGTAFIYYAERKRGKIVYRRQRDAFFDIEQGDFTKGMLEKVNVNYIQKEDSLYVIGDEAIEFANIFNRECRRPLARGVISPREKEALPMVEVIIQSMVGPPRGKGEIIYYSVPGEPLDADFDVVYHEKVIEGILEPVGYIAKPINEGMAIVFSELGEENFTGLAISFGAGMVNVCLSFMSVPIITFSLSKGGDWIDKQAATAVGETASRVCAVKENEFALTSSDHTNRIGKALSIYYDYLIEYVLARIKKQMERSEELPRVKKPVTLIVSGGTSLPKGFLDRFSRQLRRLKFPINIGEIRCASHPLQSVVQGALIAAITDGEREKDRGKKAAEFIEKAKEEGKIPLQG